jgi:ATPase complex subunit ATP10
MVEGNISIVAITHSQISEEHVKAWTKDVVERWRGHERFRFIHVCPICMKVKRDS